MCGDGGGAYTHPSGPAATPDPDTEGDPHMIADLIFALVVIALVAVVITGVEWLRRDRRRNDIEAAKADAIADAASGLTAARLRHPSTRAKEQTGNS